MCRRYAKPPESIILNVVSAMVDFSTSALLQLSRELDPSGQRTMLCVTKVDQHREIGLHKKLENATRGMQIRREHIFAVRNRTNEENQCKLSLTEARRLETQALSDNKELARGSQAAGYGLGVEMLSKKLVVRTTHNTRVHTFGMTADRADSFWPLAGDPVGPNQAHAARDSSPHLGEARPAGSSGQGDRRA